MRRDDIFFFNQKLTRQAHFGKMHAIRYEHEISDALGLRLFPR